MQHENEKSKASSSLNSMLLRGILCLKDLASPRASSAGNALQRRERGEGGVEQQAWLLASRRSTEGPEW